VAACTTSTQPIAVAEGKAQFITQTVGYYGIGGFLPQLLKKKIQK
jgi:hypothetical protein